MDDLKELIEELNRINKKAVYMNCSNLNIKNDMPLYFEIEFARKHIEDCLNSLEQSFERQERKARIA